MKILEQVPLAPLTTFQVGGPARFFAEAKTAHDVREAVDFAHAQHLPLFVLGGGSNLVISDAGWPGLVLKIGVTGIDEHTDTAKRVFEVGAGEDWDGFVARAVSRNCAGVECLSGIPGTVGGTPVQNVGAYGQEVSETITEVQTFDLRTGELRDLCREACDFSYRGSVFNTTERGRFIILKVTYTLEMGGEPRIQYADLKKHFGERTPTLQETREAVRQIRMSKAMLIVPGDEDCRSAGSFFKNPLLTGKEFEELTTRLAGRQIPNYPGGDGKVKVAAAWLVEQAGFRKGYTRGAVGISRRHALAIVNRGGATAADIIALKNEIQNKVLGEFGISLHPEPVFVGFENL